MRAFLNNSDLQNFSRTVELTHNIYNRRWGDAPLRFAACQLAFDVAAEVREFCELSYAHQGERYEPFC